MVAQSADEAIGNARRTTSNDPGMCLWYTQEWCESGHMYPDATAQWNAAQYKHAGDRNPPAGAPVSWTGGSAGHGHSALSIGGGKIRTIDQQSSGKTSEVPLDEIERDWGLTYKGWHEDLAGVRLPYLTGSSDPDNPNGVDAGDTVIVTAHGGLVERDAPGGDKTGFVRPEGDTFVVAELDHGWATDDLAGWFSTDYLHPQVKPDPANPNGIDAGDTVVVTASGGLKARQYPGGPQSLDKNGDPLVRATGYQFDVTAPPRDGWITGGTNWYSSDYLDTVDDPAPSTPKWSSSPTVILDDPTPDADRNVSYLQACVRVAALDTDDGQHFDECWFVAQDYQNSGDLRFARFHANGDYCDEWMKISDAGHGQTFHAYRSAAGNLYVWCGENPAYRYRWQPGKTVAKNSGDKMDYQGCRPVGSYEPWVGFRDATDTRETFHLFDRTDFTGNVNRTHPVKSVTVDKRTSYTQQTWAVSDTRIYRLMGSTNDDPPHGSRLHILDVFDWSGRLLLDRFDLTAMSIDTTSDEPEGLTFTGTPGNLLAGKREGSTDPKKRSYPIWTLTGLP